MTPFSCILTPQSVSFTSPEGKVYNIASDHKDWGQIVDTIKELQKALKGEAEFDDFYIGIPSRELHETLVNFVDPIKKIKEVSAEEGNVSVRAGVVYYQGEAVHNAITRRIIWGLEEGFDMTAYMRFLDNAMENPSAQAVEEMYGFMEANNMGITDDGYVLGYKRVTAEFKDLWTKTFDNSPGQTLEMRRNKVDDRATNTCSYGFHFCSISYLPHYGANPEANNKVVIVKVHPRDIVSVPVDHNNAKVRCCRYQVLSEYTGADLQDILETKPVWSASDWAEDDLADDDTSDDAWWDGSDDDEDQADATDVEDWYTDAQDSLVEAARLDDEIDALAEEDTEVSDETVSELESELSRLTEVFEALKRDIQPTQDQVAEGQRIADGINDTIERAHHQVVQQELDNAFKSDILNDPERARELAGLPGEMPEDAEPTLTDEGPNIDARAKQLFEEAEARERERQAEEEAKRLVEAAERAHEQALNEFQRQLLHEAGLALKVWAEDAKKDNLPSHEEIQALLGKLASDLRQAEIDAGLQNHSAAAREFPWEKWLAAYTANGNKPLPKDWNKEE